MKTIMLLCVLSAASVLFVPSAAPAQCPNCANGVCRPAEPEPPHGWYKGADNKLTWYQHGICCGTLDLVAGEWLTAGKTKPVNLYQAFEIQKQSQNRRRPDCRDDCPCDEPCGDDCPCCKFKDSSTVVNGTLNHGMFWKTDGGERCTVNGARVSCPKLIETLSGKSGGPGAPQDIPDDSKLPRLVVLSKDATVRKNIVGDFAGLKDWQGKAIAQAYPPDDWAVDGLYPMPVDPTLYYVDADGLPRGCSKGYSAGQAGMAIALANAEKLRNPTGVDPSKAPDLAKPVGPGGPGSSTIGSITPNQAGIGGLALLAAGVGAAIYRKRQKNNASV